MFRRFVHGAPGHLPVRVQPLPVDHPRGYQELADELLGVLPTEPFALIAESFSGPLALMLANRCERVRAVVLGASFVRPPVPKLLAHLPGWVWRGLPPAFALRWLMTGGDRELADGSRAAVAKVDNAVVAARVAAVLSVDAAGELRRLRQPLLCLRAVRDRLVPARSAAEIARLKPDATIVAIDAPHLVLQARASECWRVIAPFLEQAFGGLESDARMVNS